MADGQHQDAFGASHRHADGVARGASPLRGREGAVGVIASCLAALSDGHAAAFVVEGGPGLGKTRVLDEAATTAARQGVAVGRGGALPDEGTMPFAPLMTALVDAEVVGPEDVRRLRGGTHDRWWLLQELQELLERRATRGPVALLLDDLQWADGGTVAALDHLTRRLAAHPVAWAAAYRQREASGALARVARELQDRGASRIVLEPLDAGAVAAVTADAVGGAPDAGLLELAGAARGNPFLLTETLLGLEEDGLLRRTGGQVGVLEHRLPQRVRRTMRDRLDRLSPEARRAAVSGAVLGRRFRLEDVAELVALRPAATVESLEELVRADILRDDGEGFAFRHDLLREDVLGTLSAATRTALDRQAGEVLLAAGASPAAVAPLFLPTAEAGDEQAIDTLRRAAREIGASDPSAAGTLSRRALELLPHGAPGRIDLLCETALWMELAGRADAGHAFIGRALDAAPTVEEHGALALAIATLFKLRPAIRVEAGRSALALDGLPEDLRAMHASVMVINLVADGQAAAGRAAAERAAVLVAETGNATARSMLEMSRLSLDLAEGDFGATLRRAAAMTVGGADARDRVIQHAAAYFRVNALIGTGEVELAIDELGRNLAGETAEDSGTFEPRRELDRGRCLLLAGRIDEARAALEGVLLGGVLPVPLPIPPDAAGLLALGRLGLRTDDRRLIDRCVAIAEATLAVDTSDSRRHLTWMLALVALSRGDAPGVRDALARQGDLSRESVLPLLARDPTDPPQLVRAERLTGDHVLARRAVVDAEDRARRNPTVRVLEGVALHARGLLDDDEAALRGAVDGLRDGPWPFALASAQEDLGCLLLGTGPRGDALDALQHAHDLYDGHGATRDARRVRRRLRAVGVRRRSSSPRPDTGWPALTPAELDVVALVVQGLTNREAAGRLFVSPHTVNSHLRHVFAKLGINSRLELARWAAEHGAA